jgi:hypothetical protein
MADYTIKHRDEFETILNRSEALVTALLIGVVPDGNYEPISWA